MIYLDHNATTPLDPAVLEAMLPYLREHHGNPSSVHAAGQAARRGIDRARRQVAELVGASESEVTFTSGGSEADNLALAGVMQAAVGASEPARRELIVSRIEHPAVLEHAAALEARGFVVRRLEVTAAGLVDPEALRALVCEQTALVSVMYANNETGVIQPVKEVGEIAHAAGAKFHCDAVQAFWKLALKPKEIGADLMSLAGAKFGGPKGTGLLYNEMTNRISPVIVGGPQEWGYRAGTEDMSGMAALATAMELSEAEREKIWPRVEKIRDAMEERIIDGLGAQVRINGKGAPRLPNISNISFLEIEGQALAIELGEQGYCVGLGSACAPGETDPSHVLAAMGLSWEDAIGCIRVSFGPDITAEQANRLADLCVANYKHLKGIG